MQDIALHGIAHCINLVDQRGILPHRFFRVKNPGQSLVLDLDQVKGFLRNIRVDGCNGSYFIPVGPDLFPLQGYVILQEPKPDGRDIPPRQHRPHTDQLFRLGGVNAVDFGMGKLAKEDLSVEHSRYLEIIHVGGPSRYLIPGVAFGNPLANVEVFLHRYLPLLVALIASMIWIYPVHRQKFPAIAVRISSSEGLEFSSSRALADITMPGVQKPH